jgi:mersacidin/lichenicidin family type 2 lantibiotic
MSLGHIIEAWRDEEYRENLDAETRALLPENPAGEIELSEAELSAVDGGTTLSILYSVAASSEACASVVVSVITALVCH